MRFVLPAVLLVLGAISLSAGDVRFGVQGALAIPMGDLSDGANLGLQGGGHGVWDLGQGHGIMGRIDMTLYSKKNDTNVTSLAIAADYTYHLNQNQTGPYVLAGVSNTNFNPSPVHNSESDNGFGIDLGVGYDVDRNLGYQARITSNSVDHGTLTSLNLGVTYRF